MKQLSIFLTIALLLWSCVKTKSEALDHETEKEAPIELGSNAPCIELQEFVVDIENIKWVSDTNRLKKAGLYRELNRQKVKHFNDKPFYPISFENSQLSRTYSSEMEDVYFDSLDFELFKGVQNIWGFFYRDKEATDWITDGVIEQWEFENEDKANQALQQIRRPGSIIYFNTNPYFCRIRNMLIIFQTRAMAFSYDQKPIFEKFVREKVPKGT